MKISLFISTLGGGGAERVVCNLANYLYAKGYETQVVTLSNYNDAYKLNPGIYRVCLLDKSDRTNKIYNLYREWKNLKKYLTENKDISCHVVMLPIPSFLLIKLRKLVSGKVIVSDRNNPSSHKFYNKLMMKYAAKRCDGFVVQTKEIADWYNFVKNKTVIPNAINDDITFPSVTKKEKKFVAVGRLQKQKNYPMMLEAFGLFSKKHPEYILEIYGQGEQQRYLEDKVTQLGLNKKVEFKGYINNISESISTAECFLMSSNHEGISNALIEAMCMGLPCVVTNCDGGGAKFLIENYKNGLLVDKNAASDMASKMCEIVEDDSLRERISKEAKKKKNELSAKKIYAKWLRYILSVADGGVRE